VQHAPPGWLAARGRNPKWSGNSSWMRRDIAGHNRDVVEFRPNGYSGGGSAKSARASLVPIPATANRATRRSDCLGDHHPRARPQSNWRHCDTTAHRLRLLYGPPTCSGPTLWGASSWFRGSQALNRPTLTDQPVAASVITVNSERSGTSSAAMLAGTQAARRYSWISPPSTSTRCTDDSRPPGSSSVNRVGRGGCKSRLRCGRTVL
jgi:hypothetical protein